MKRDSGAPLGRKKDRMFWRTGAWTKASFEELDVKVPVVVVKSSMSCQGESPIIAAGRGSLKSRSLRTREVARLPPAESP